MSVKGSEFRRFSIADRVGVVFVYLAKVMQRRRADKYLLVKLFVDLAHRHSSLNHSVGVVDKPALVVVVHIHRSRRGLELLLVILKQCERRL